MENENAANYRTPLAVKTQKNLHTIKNENLKNLKKNPLINDTLNGNLVTHNKNEQNFDKSKLKFLQEDLSQTNNILDEEDDDFSYNNYNNNFKTQKNFNDEETMIINPILLKEVNNESNSPSNSFEQSDINNYIKLMLSKEIIYINSKDLERMAIVDNFVNEGLFFSDFI